MAYPYLLRGLAITRPNQVWCSDVTYIPMAQGFCYLVAIMDWATRAVLSWWLSPPWGRTSASRPFFIATGINGYRHYAP